MAAATAPPSAEPRTEHAEIRSISPYTGETLKTYTAMSVNEVDEAIAKAHERFATWRSTPFAERAALRCRAAALCRERREDLARFMALEMGKRIVEGRQDVDICAGIFDYYAEHGERFLRPQTIPSPAGDGTLLLQPLGALFAIEPWNYPFYQVVRVAAPNLMAGNTVLLKHSTSVQQCAEAAAALFRDAGFPPGVFTNLVISSRLANKVIDDDRVHNADSRIMPPGPQRTDARACESRMGYADVFRTASKQAFPKNVSGCSTDARSAVTWPRPPALRDPRP